MNPMEIMLTPRGIDLQLLFARLFEIQKTLRSAPGLLVSMKWNRFQVRGAVKEWERNAFFLSFSSFSSALGQLTDFFYAQAQGI